jgi:hypothetical protein
MLISIINVIFSVPYLLIGVIVAALMDLGIHYTKSSKRFTLLEIWGCTMCWPAILIVFSIAAIKGNSSN